MRGPYFRPNVSFLWVSKPALPITTLYKSGLSIVTCKAWDPCYHVTMIESFKDQAAEDLFNGVNSKVARKACPRTLWRIVSRKLDQLDSVQSLEELKIPPGNRLEGLSGERKAEYSIRVNEQYRICFKWGNLGPKNVEVVDYH